MTGLSEYRSKSAALLRIVTCAVIVLALLRQWATWHTDRQWRSNAHTPHFATDGNGRKYRHPRHYIQRRKCNRHSPTESIGIQGKQFHGNVQL